MNNSKLTLPSNKKFGIFFSFIFSLLGLYFFKTESINLSNIFFILGILFLLTALIRSSLLKPLNILWMRLGILLGVVISPLILGIIYYLLFTPYGLIMKIFGRDELNIRFYKKNSYWRLRISQMAESSSFKNQF